MRSPAIIPLAVILMFANNAIARDRPTINWRIQTVISNEEPFRHKIVKRAILAWGETWPILTIEIIDWRQGMGGQQLLSTRRIDIEGQNPVCPDPAESWCGTLGDLYWEDDIFVHHFSAKSSNFICKTLVSDEAIGQTDCDINP